MCHYPEELPPHIAFHKPKLIMNVSLERKKPENIVRNKSKYCNQISKKILEIELAKTCNR